MADAEDEGAAAAEEEGVGEVDAGGGGAADVGSGGMLASNVFLRTPDKAVASIDILHEGV